MPQCYFCGELYSDKPIHQGDYSLHPYHVHKPGAIGRAGAGGAIIGTAGGHYSTNPGVSRGYRRVYPIDENIRWLNAGIELGRPFYIFTNKDALAVEIEEGYRKNTLLFEIMYLHAIGYSFVLTGGRVIAELSAAPRLSADLVGEMLRGAALHLEVGSCNTFWTRWKDHFKNVVLPAFPGAAAHPAAPATTMFRLHLQHNPNASDARFRASLNRSPQAVEIRLSGQHVAIAATHWAWHSAQVLRVEGPDDLDTRFSVRPVRRALVDFNNPGFSLTVVNITRDA